MITWFEIPVTDMDRAQTFYSDLLQLKFGSGAIASTLDTKGNRVERLVAR